jgi:hypothetical protein
VTPTPQQWRNATWHARSKWAADRRLSLLQAQALVLRTAAARKPLPVDDWEDPFVTASLTRDRDPIHIAFRRALGSGITASDPRFVREVSA